ncbi:MAG: hypothetical protein ACJAT2_003741 [Bacteriovoracaceae bacterium]|jgi:hypothetical protein
MLKIWIILFISSLQFASASPLENLPELSALSVDQRVSYWSNHFLGTPYAKNGPLGEGSQGLFDQDPLYRFDQFDCTTFVETITALSLSTNKDEFLVHLNALRYKNSEVSYQTRNHITSLQWIPENIQNGYFKESSQDFPSSMLRTVENSIDMPSWFRAHDLSRLKLPSLSKRKKKKRLKDLQKDIAKEFQVSAVRLNYLSIKEVLNDWDGFEDSLDGIYIINIVRPNWNLVSKIGTKINISHQGFLLKKEGVPTMIHASTTGEVVQVRLKTYLNWFKNSGTIKGINLLNFL